MSAKPFITQISGKPSSGEAKTVFRSGAVSTDLLCAKFFMIMQDQGASVEDARRYAEIGPMLEPAADWDEINRVLKSFGPKP